LVEAGNSSHGISVIYPVRYRLIKELWATPLTYTTF
jgi:hypothetical protein